MNLHRDLSILLLAAFVMAAGAADAIDPAAKPIRMAAPYPTKPIRMIVPSGVGSSPDITARILAREMAETLKQPIVVENIPGASGNIGMEKGARAAPDGYTVVIGTVGPLYMNYAFFSDTGYDIERDFEPVTEISRSANVLVVNPALPIHSVAELVAYGRANPGKLRFGSVGKGSSLHVCAEVFVKESGIDALHIPYKSAAQMAIDLISGQFEFAFSNAAPVLPHIRAGRLRALAVTTRDSFRFTPELPTMIESGFQDLVFDGGMGLLVPKGTPRIVADRIAAAAIGALRSPSVRGQFAAQGVVAVGSDTADFRQHLQAERARWAPLVGRIAADPN